MFKKKFLYKVKFKNRYGKPEIFYIKAQNANKAISKTISYFKRHFFMGFIQEIISVTKMEPEYENYIVG